MLLTLSLFTVGIAAALVAEYVGTKTTLGAAIHAECLCWATLAAILYVRRHVARRHKQAGDMRHGTEDAATVWNPMLWAVSFCIAVARIMPLYYNLTSALVGIFSFDCMNLAILHDRTGEGCPFTRQWADDNLHKYILTMVP